MTNLLTKLQQTLQKDKRLVDEGGGLLKNKIVELTLKHDKELINILIKEKDLKEHFFIETGEVVVFDQSKFMKFVDNKEFLPDSYTTFKNKIGLTVDGMHISQSKDVVLSWPYKDCILEGGMEKEDEKRDEVFFNEILAPDEIDKLKEPKIFTNFKRIDAKAEHKVTEIKPTDNLIIRGNNLLALCSLKKKFAGMIKLIYIDVPYGKDADTFYNDRFKRSTWLTFMKNRLEIAESLLCDEGAIFVQIGDDNVSALRLLMDEVFTKENFVNKITVKTKSPSGFKTVNLGVFEVAEYILLYAKCKNKWKYIPQYVEVEYDENYKYFVENMVDDPKNWKILAFKDYVALKTGHKDSIQAVKKIGKSSFMALVAENALQHADKVFRLTAIGNDAGKETLEIKKKSESNKGKVFVVPRENHSTRFILDGQEISFYKNKIREIDGQEVPTTLLTNIWMDISWEGIASEGGVKLKKGKKPERLLRRIIDMGSAKGEIVLDYHLGSGTTCAVAHKMGRQYIGIEQLEYGNNDPIIRLKNVINDDSTGVSKTVNWRGGGDFVYCELMKWNEKYIDEIKMAKTSKELIKIWDLMKEKAFLSYKVDVKEFDNNVKEFEQLSLENQKKFLIECLDKNQLYANLSEIDDVDYAVSEEDKGLNKKFYGVF